MQSYFRFFTASHIDTICFEKSRGAILREAPKVGVSFITIKCLERELNIIGQGITKRHISKSGADCCQCIHCVLGTKKEVVHATTNPNRRTHRRKHCAVDSDTLVDVIDGLGYEFIRCVKSFAIATSYRL